MSTQYEVIKKDTHDEVAALNEQLKSIQDACLNRIKSLKISSELEEIMEELADKLSNRYLFSIDVPDSASVVIGTARADHFSWRSDNGFRDLHSFEQWFHAHPEFCIIDEYGEHITWEEFREVVAWCGG